MQERIDYRKINFEAAKKYFQGKNVVFTGRGFLVRGELMRLARQAGANVDSLVTKKCDVLIVGEKPGSKLRKAKILGCEIISTADFKNILEGVKLTDLYNLRENNDILNINAENNINSNKIAGKRINLIINNHILRDKAITNIKRNCGIIINSPSDNFDILVYQPNSEAYAFLEKINKNNKEIFTVAQFNKMFL